MSRVLILPGDCAGCASRPLPNLKGGVHYPRCPILIWEGPYLGGPYLGGPYLGGLSRGAYLGARLHAGIYSPSAPDSHFNHPTLAHFTMAPPPVEVDPQLAEIEEWEAAALVSMEELEQRTQRTQRLHEREHHELHRE